MLDREWRTGLRLASTTGAERKQVWFAPGNNRLVALQADLGGVQ